MASHADELRTILDHIPVMVCRCDTNHRYRFVNSAYAARFGRDPESLAGLHLSEILGRRAYNAIRPYFEKCLTGERVEFEIEIPYESGPRIIRCAYEPERDLDGQVIGLIAAITDETPRVRAEEALRLSRDHLDFIVQSTEIGVWTCDLPFDVLLWNAKCKEHFGLPASAVVTIDTFYDRLHPDDVERTRAAVEKAIAERVGYDAEYRTKREDGYRWIRAIGRAAYAADGTPVRFDGITVDVTKQKETEALLRERETYFRSMADTAPAMLWVSDAQGHCTYLSKQWYEYTGRGPADELGLGWLESIHPDDRDRANDVLLNASARHVPFALDYRLRNQNGEYRWAVDAGMPRTSAAGEFLGFVGSVIDVHDRKMFEQALADADRRKDEFLATLAHELRNPLAPLLTALRLINQAGDDLRLRERALGIMGRQLTQLVRLVDDLLDVSRITRGKLQVRRELVQLAHIVHAAVEATGAGIAAQGHRLIVTLPDTPIYLNADATRLTQVFQNLLNNAGKYTPPGGNIELRAEIDGDVVRVLVKDSGIGFEPRSAEHIFEMFTQTDESRELSQGGLGIGLTLVRELVEMHGGRVVARSEGKGLGSIFEVTVPIVAGTEVRAAVPLRPASMKMAPRRVLIADDNVDAATSLALLLQQEGHDVRTAHDGEEALAVAANFAPEVVLLDIGMPRLNGYETALRLRQLPAGESLVIAALTGWGQPRDHERSRAAGIDQHFRKPVDRADLQRLLETQARRDVHANGIANR